MGKIRQLDEQTTNMIAAGEVVERPMGVVKELVENAIDAGSTRITVDIEEGGMQRITITDNGVGMDREDAQQCFQRHATSKIKTQNDLWSIRTLGFRGEALPSIAAVSRVTLTTSDGVDNTRVIIDYGKLESAVSYPCNQGTEITVEGLFYRTPARLKHMRSASYEASLIQDVLTRFALSHPEISFQLIHDNREIFRTGGQGSLLEVVYNVYGQGPAENAIEVDFSDYDYHVHGYIIKPFITRASRNMMFLFLNGRMVRTYKLYKAVQEGYHGLIPENRYPLCVLEIEMDPHLLDVNVHPSKWEVRISKEIQLEVLIRDEIEKALHTDDIVPEVQPQTIRTTYYEPMSFDADELMQKEPEPVVQEETAVQTSEIPAAEEVQQVEETEEVVAEQPQTTWTLEDEIAEDNRILQELQNKIAEPEPVYEEEVIPFPHMDVIGQFHDRYILAETPTGLVILDQQNARKRIQFEKTLKQLEETPVMMELLIPLTLQVSDILVSQADEINEKYASLHIEFEPFGHDTLIVRRVPSWFDHMEQEQFLQDLLDAYEQEKDHTVRQVKEQIARIASRRISNAVQKYTRDECAEIIQQLSVCRHPYTTIDGKPVFVILDEADLTKELR